MLALHASAVTRAQVMTRVPKLNHHDFIMQPLPHKSLKHLSYKTHISVATHVLCIAQQDLLSGVCACYLLTFRDACS